MLRNRKGGVVDCNSYGGNHFERDYPELNEIVEDTLKASGKKTEQALVTVDKVMAAVEDFDLNEWSILCDTESTISIMSNEELVYNIRPTAASSEVTGYGGGCRQINLEASTKRFGTVNFDPEGVGV